MSRRCHHGSPRHLRQAARERRRGPVVADRPPTAPAERGFEARVEDLPAPSDEPIEPSEQLRADDATEVPAESRAESAALDDAPAADSMEAASAAPPDAMPAADAPSHVRPSSVATPGPDRPRHPERPRGELPIPAGAGPMRPPHRPREIVGDADAAPGEPSLERGATAPQLRRFIKSRAYVPMHELRRRFSINGGDDDVIPIDVDRQRVYVGLPPREGSLLGELLRAGDIGYELSLDPIAPIVVGVYPMRPVPRS